MDWNAAIGAIGAIVLAALAVTREWGSNRGQRSRIKQDIEILSLLPDDSPVAAAMREHVDRNILRLVEYDQVLRRDPSGIGLAIAFAAGTAWTVYLGAVGSDLWFGLAAILGTFTAVGFGQSFPKRHRNERGNVIAPPSAAG